MKADHTLFVLVGLGLLHPARIDRRGMVDAHREVLDVLEQEALHRWPLGPGFVVKTLLATVAGAELRAWDLKSRAREDGGR